MKEAGLKAGFFFCPNGVGNQTSRIKAMKAPARDRIVEDRDSPDQ
jgi:hypothetical protein